MTFTEQQLNLIIFSLIRQRSTSISNGEALVIEFNEGRFKGKHYGPQNEEALQRLLNAFDQEVEDLNKLIEIFEKQREENREEQTR